MGPAGGEDRAFGRGVRIAVGFAALLVVAVMIAVVQHDHPLRQDNGFGPPKAPSATAVAHLPGPSGSDLSHR